MILRLLGCILTAEILEYPQDANHHPSGNVGTSVIGLIVALSCNLAFLKAILGFFLGAIFFAASIVCQAVFVNKAFFSVEDAGLDDSTLSGFRKSVLAHAERSVGSTASFLGFTLPMVLAAADMGPASESLLILGAVGAASIWGPYSIMESAATFEDYDSFIQYMQQDISAASGYHTEKPDAVAVQIPYGTEDAPTRRLEDKNGNVVCEYIDRNETVVSLRSTPKDRTLLPITVCTEDDLRAAQQTAAVRHVIFCAAYCLECLVIAAVYIRKKAK